MEGRGVDPGLPLVSHHCLSCHGHSSLTTCLMTGPPHSREGRGCPTTAAHPPQCVSTSRPALSGAPAALRVAPQWSRLWHHSPLPVRPSSPLRDGASIEQLSQDTERSFPEIFMNGLLSILEIYLDRFSSFYVISRAPIRHQRVTMDT